jgi:hypothetical protein
VVLDGPVPPIDRAAFKQFLPVTTREFSPRDRLDLACAQQCFARAKIGHPYIIASGEQSTASKASGKYAEPILLRLDRGVDAFGFDHGSGSGESSATMAKRRGSSWCLAKIDSRVISEGDMAVLNPKTTFYTVFKIHFVKFGLYANCHP